MAIQYNDGSFSETLPFKEIMEKFDQDMMKALQIRAIHFGTFAEIEEVKKKQGIEDRIAELEQKVREMSPVRTTLEIPTKEEVMKITGLKVL